MSFHRGDVVIVDFYPTDPRSKVRPALVVQNDRDNARMKRTIVIQITSNVSRSHEDTHCHVFVKGDTFESAFLNELFSSY